jgi:hypothetical protein
MRRQMIRRRSAWPALVIGLLALTIAAAQVCPSAAATVAKPRHGRPPTGPSVGQLRPPADSSTGTGFGWGDAGVGAAAGAGLVLALLGASLLIHHGRRTP